MAFMMIDGLYGLMSDLETAADIPDSVASEMLKAEAEVVIKAHKAEVKGQGIYRTGQLHGSIKNAGMKSSGDTRYVDVYPQGNRKNGIRNAEVGFIHEYGAKRRHILAKEWMNKANEFCTDEATEAAKKVYDQFLESKKL